MTVVVTTTRSVDDFADDAQPVADTSNTTAVAVFMRLRPPALDRRCDFSRTSGPSDLRLAAAPRCMSVEHRRRDQLFEVPVGQPRDLELLGPPEVELDVVFDREADAAEDLLRGRRDV